MPTKPSAACLALSKPKKLYGREYEGIERSTFVLDAAGEIRHEWRKVKVAGHAQQVLDTLRAEAA